MKKTKLTKFLKYFFPNVQTNDLKSKHKKQLTEEEKPQVKVTFSTKLQAQGYLSSTKPFTDLEHSNLQINCIIRNTIK